MRVMTNTLTKEDKGLLLSVYHTNISKWWRREKSLHAPHLTFNYRTKHILMLTKIKMSSEYLSKDILEEDFLKTFTPYHICQKVLGSCRVNAKNRFVTAPTRWQRGYTVFCMTLLTLCYVKMFLIFTEKFSDNVNISFLIVTMLIVQVIIFTSNLIHVRFLTCHDNIEFYIKMQEIDRIMKIDKDKTLSSLQYKVHVMSILFLSLSALGLVSLSFTGGIITAILLCSGIYCEAPFAVEMSHCSNIMLYFALRIRLVNAIVSNHIYGNTSSKPLISDMFTNHYMKNVAAKIHDFKTSETDIYLREIIRGFNMYKDLYKFQVIYKKQCDEQLIDALTFQILLLCVKIFIYALITFEYTLLSVKYNIYDVVHIAAFSTIITVDLLTVTFLCLRCEIFIRSVKETKLLTISVMSIYLDGPLRKKAKCMYDIIEEIPPDLSIYDMWDLDARIVFALFYTITNFIVTLLQFAFL
ncbi:uncharacterized protein LOC135073439 [Ostrinia nubilalis]|uniref:uncharacterized protein LOC135073439 n=1 Tax=Ostrinia nubilalis TaxID=29057 RepID=UPI00308251C2